MAFDLSFQEKHELLSGLTHLKDSMENLDLPDYSQELLRIAISLEELVEIGRENAEAFKKLIEAGKEETNEG